MDSMDTQYRNKLVLFTSGKYNFDFVLSFILRKCETFQLSESRVNTIIISICSKLFLFCHCLLFLPTETKAEIKLVLILQFPIPY